MIGNFLRTTRLFGSIFVPTLTVSMILAVQCSGDGECNMVYTKSNKQVSKQISSFISSNLIFNNINEDNDISTDIKIREYKMSARGHEFIKSFEKCELTAYHIPGEKHNTIGWGHYLQKPSEKNIKRISQAHADELFREDIVWVDKAVTSMLNDVNPEYIWPQGIVDGLGSLVFNCGERGVRTTEFYRRLQNCRFENGQINKSDIVYTLASVKTTRCTKRGHYKRRAGEYAMMNEIIID